MLSYLHEIVFKDFIKFSGSIFFDSKTSFLIVNAFFPFCVNILRHRRLSRLEFSMTKYGNMVESNQSLKLLILLLLCHPCPYEYHSIIDYSHFATFCFLYVNSYFGATIVLLLSNRKCQQTCFCLESFL